MKHCYSLLTALLLGLLIFSSDRAEASHAMGADISYQCIDPATNRFYVEFSFYRDCAGAGAPFTATINISSATCGQNLNIVLPKKPPGPPPPGSTDSFEVTPLCQSLIGNSTCNGGTLPGVERHVYCDTITLPANCPDWVMSYQLCCRNNQITNLQNASSQSMYVQATLNNTIGCNSSPKFTSLPVPYICSGLPFNYNHGVIEPDGDSLVFSLVSPLTAGGTPIAHVPPFTPTQPINTTGPFVFNQNNGQMSFTANGVQVAVVTIQVDEYRNGVLIGSTMRDVQIVVVNVPGCVNSAIRFRGIDSATVNGSIFIDTTRVEACPGDTIEFTYMAFNIAGDTISMTTNIDVSIPNAILDTIQTAVDTIYGKVTWIPTSSDTGLNFFIASFNSCPIASSQAYAMEIFVLPGTDAGGDKYYCPAGGPVRLRAVGGSQFQWTPGFGLSDSTIRNPLASPGVTTTYFVSSNLLSGCKNNDTITVFAVPDFAYNLTVSDDTVCKFDSVQLATNTDPNFAPYTYDWFVDDFLNANNIGDPYGNPERTLMWQVEMISDSGCRITDSIGVVVAGDRPQISFDGYTTICDGDSARITAVPCLSPALFDDFDPGLDGSMWALTQSNVGPDAQCGAVSGTNALVFNGATGRAIISNPIDVSNGGTVSFWIKEGTGTFNNCDRPDLGDDIVLEYSINGGVAWVQIGTNYQPGNYSNWTFIEETIPPAAQTIATQFRWTQVGFSFQGGDNWAIDDVMIQCCGNSCANYAYNWTPNVGISDPSVGDPIFYPAGNQTYTVTVSPAGTDCASSESVPINIAPDFDWDLTISDDTICRNETSQFNLDLVDTALGPYTITWTPASGLSDSSISNPVASPVITTTYSVEMISALGCIQYDTVTLIVAGSAPVVSILGYDSLCEGDSIILTASPCVGIFEENFDDGFDPILWGNISAGMLADVACGFVSSPNVMVFAGGTFGTPRFAETIDLDLSGGGSVSFWLKAGDGSGGVNCENVDFNEDLFLEYSTNGGATWNPVNAANPFYIEADYSNGVFEFVTEAIPAGAQTPATRFRWIQNQHSGGGIDNWLIDDIIIECCGDNCGNFTYSWSPTSFISDFNSADPFFFPPSTTNYTVIVGIAGTECANDDSVTISVGPDFNLGVATPNPDSICLYGTTQLEVFPEVGKGPYSYIWSPTSVSDSTIRDPFAAPTVTTTYSVSVTNFAGCRKVADMIVYVDGVAPQVTVLPDDNFICPGDTVNLAGSISTVPCGLNQVPCQGQFGFSALGTTQGTSTTVSPYRGASRQARVQYLIRASELQAAGVQAGTISDIVFDVSTKTSGGPYLDLTIKMGCTTLDELNAYVEGLPTVDYNAQYFTVQGFANTHNLDNPFDWDGSSNVIIEVCFENPGGQPGGNDVVNVENLGYNATYSGTSFTVPAGCSITNGFASQQRPVMQFIYCFEPPAGITYYWEPTGTVTPPDSLNVFVNPQTTSTYLLYADDGTCLGSGWAVINIDSSYYLNAGNDTFTCNSVPIQLNAQVVGQAPSNPNCGTNGSGLFGSVDTVYVEPPFPSSSTISPFLADNINFLPQVITDQRMQILYLAQDLIAAGLTPGVISELAFDVSFKSSTRPFRSFNIGLGCTNQTFLDGTTWIATDNVYSRDSISTVAGWNNFQMDSTFDWDGISNIVVEVCWDNTNPNFPNGIDNVNSEFMPYVATHTNIATLGQGCGLAPNANNLFTTRPNIRFTTYPPAPGNVNYQWDITNSLSDLFIPNPFADPLNPELYVITAEFANGCVLQDSVFVNIFQINADLTDDFGLCEGDSATITASGADTYIWDSIPGLSCYDCPTPVASPDSTTMYYVTILSNNGCRVRDSVLVNVSGIEAIAWFRDTLVDQGDTVVLGADVITSLSPLTYSWSPSTYLNDSTLANPTAIPIYNDQTYILTVSANGCFDTTFIFVDVDIIASPFNMPNAFTPNGDGLNDTFYPLTGGLAEVSSFKVYNRWGELLHDDADNAWDGTKGGKLQPADTYIFYVEISIPFQDVQYSTGTIELIR